MKDLGIPLGMVAQSSSVSVAVVRAIHPRNTVKCIRGAVSVNKVHQDDHAEAVSTIDHFLEFLWCARTACWSEEARHVVTETSVVRVLRDCHQLHGVVPEALDSRQHLVCKFQVRSHLWQFRGHAHVSLVHLHCGGRTRAWVPEHVLKGRCPEDPVEQVCGWVLPRQLRPRRHTLNPFTTVRFHPDLHLATMVQQPCAIDIGKMHRPATERLRGERRGILPLVELADEKDLLGLWKPLAIRPPIITWTPVKTKDLVALRKFQQTFGFKFGFPPTESVDTGPDMSLHAFQQWINLKRFQRHGHKYNLAEVPGSVRVRR
mmetsp:Transcript_38357/g.102093  ORF Transcript_38357/g.102093 Transcript_38357/m.102093 type:complete len:317 (+) Transcript_38357:5620-6570(+)